MEGFDLSTISDLYVGSTQYSEIYYGSDKVWPTETLPYNAEIEYLEATGTQYIITDLYGDNNLGFEIKFIANSLGSQEDSQSSTLFGSRQSSVANAFQLSSYQNGTLDFGNKLNTQLGIRNINIEYIANFTNSSLCINNQCSNINTNYTFQTPTPLYIFALYQSSITSVIECFIGKIYYVKFFNRTTLEPIAEYTPVRIGQTGYMYDKINGQLFGNSGTGSFILGPDIN